jgi:hypothetical protein
LLRARPLVDNPPTPLAQRAAVEEDAS